MTVYDIAIIGGGINGVGIARDAAGRGAKVLLLEAGDLAGGTSSASTKLVHGGLRYLEHYEFALVRESLKEREALWGIAPHIIWPMRFVLPHVKGLRPRWLLRLGLFLYDHIGGRKLLPATRSIRLDRDVAGTPLKPGPIYGFEYSDCWVDDARLVVLNARDAANRGADIRTHTAMTAARRNDGLWDIEARNEAFRARVIVNAAGPAVRDALQATGQNAARQIRLVRGSHIVVPRMFAHDKAYFFQIPDGRIFFAIPYEENFTLIGTTDADHHGPLTHVTASAEEILYLCKAANAYFRQQLTPADVVWSYAGVRPLVDDGSGRPEAATRGYSFEIDAPLGDAPILSVFGGKITTYRHLAEEVMEKLSPYLPVLDGDSWTTSEVLPGGDFPIDGAKALAAEFECEHIDAFTARRWARSYGTLARGWKDQRGQHFGAGLHAVEVDHLIAREWAVAVEDIIWRRTKLGLRLSAPEIADLGDYLARNASILAR
ncbi:MAG: glycerol-3-phosphate dehydrogenase [Parasphingorhabdus sp.]|nr:glycerol-3-phosphate dehydrogenase [Parasphingorhabdus sp.]